MLFCLFFFEQKKYWTKKHLSKKIKELTICTILAIWQFSLRLMALRYMGKLLIVLKFAYSGFPDFFEKFHPAKLGWKGTINCNYFLLWDFKWYWYLHVNVNLDIIIYILLVIMTIKMVIMPIMIIIMIIFRIFI